MFSITTYFQARLLSSWKKITFIPPPECHTTAISSYSWLINSWSSSRIFRRLIQNSTFCTVDNRLILAEHTFSLLYEKEQCGVV